MTNRGSAILFVVIASICACSCDDSAAPQAVVAQDGGGDSASDSGNTGTCNGCVTGALGKGGDSMTVTSVTGLVDGNMDNVEVSGTFHLASAASAFVKLTCEGQSSSGAGQPAVGPDGTFSMKSSFETCASDIVKVSLSDSAGAGSSSNLYVKCCFKKGRDF